MSATPCVRIRRNRPWRNPRTSDPRSWPHTAEPSPRPMFSVRSVGDHQEPGRIVNRETRAYFGWGRTDAVAGANRALPKSRQNRRQKTGRLARPSILGLAVAAKPPRTPYSWCKIVLRLESYHHHRHQTGAHSTPVSIRRRSMRCRTDIAGLSKRAVSPPHYDTFVVIVATTCKQNIPRRMHRVIEQVVLFLFG